MADIAQFATNFQIKQKYWYGDIFFLGLNTVSTISNYFLYEVILFFVIPKYEQ